MKETRRFEGDVVPGPVDDEEPPLRYQHERRPGFGEEADRVPGSVERPPCRATPADPPGPPRRKRPPRSR